ncbi:MAG: L-arabinose isomerase [Anaerolineae bacterium]|jgi:L-arabinose isomerase|nr:L-arabinose isomerase [Anaerolineae bacterium]
MKSLRDFQFWFIVGSQHLYGPEVLETVKEHAITMAEGFNTDPDIPCSVKFAGLVTTLDEVTAVMNDANHDNHCAGVITWMHTFSPSKMWIQGLSLLNKPYLHLNTQFNRSIPYDSIDMDFMNLNQSAHGDREHGFISARLRKPRKIISGFWKDEAMRSRIASWMRSAAGVAVSRSLKVARFGDNMREVAVTEGDKVEAQRQFGWSVNTWGVGDFVEGVNAVKDTQVEAKMAEYNEKYILDTDQVEAVHYQAKMEVALETFLAKGGFGAYTDTFEDLFGLEQLPGLATQNLMSKGYGFGAEGDWKSSAMLHIMKVMAEGLEAGVTFMEDYTYDLDLGKELVLGAHMLEICPSIAANKPRIHVDPLGIGGKNAPARLIFDGKAGPAILVTLIDLGNRFRMIVHDIEAKTPVAAMPKLPVARVMWKPMPDLITGSECWITAGGAHHSIFSYGLTAEHMRDWAEIMQIEFIHITADSTVNGLKQQLMTNEVFWKFMG